MNPERIAPAAIDDFLLALRAEGFAVGVGECVRVHALIARLGPGHPACADWPSLGPWLAPIVCRRPSEQEAFARVLATWRAQHAPAAPDAATAAPPPPVAAARRLQRRLTRARWLPVLLALALLAGLWLAARLPVPAPAASLAVAPALPAVVAEPEHWLEKQMLRLQRALAAPPERAPLIALGWALAIGLASRHARRRRALARRFGVRGAAELARLGTAAGTRYLDTPALRQHLQALRLHQQQPTRRLDVPATLAATLRAGGRPVPVYDTRPLAPEYLLLAPLGGHRDLRADLADELDARLREEQVHVERYSYLSTPRWLRPVPATGGRELALDVLAARAAGSHLLLVDDGAALIDPLRGRPADWSGPLEGFALRVLLTPVPPAQWGARERALEAAGWIVLQLATAELGRLADALRVGLRADGEVRLPPRVRLRAPDAGDRRGDRYPALLALDEPAWLDRRAPAPERIARLLAELRGFLGPEAFEWLGALAVFPRLHPALTRYLGARLTDAAGQPLAADERRLAALARLPWLRQAFMPDWLRLALIGALPAARETAVRDALTAALLLGQDAPDGGLLEVVTGHAELRAVLVELLRTGRGAHGRERILLRFLRGEPLEVSAPRAFVERLKRVAASPAGYWLAVAAASAAAWSLWPADGLLARFGLPAVDLTRPAEGIVSALPWFDPAVLVLAIAGVWHWLAGQLRGRAVRGARAIDAALAAVALAGLPALALLVAVPVAASDTGPALLHIPGAPLRYVLAPTLLAFLTLWLRRLALPDGPMRPNFAHALVRPPETHRRLALRLAVLVALGEALFWAAYGSFWLSTGDRDPGSAASVLSGLGAGPVRAFVLAGAALFALRGTLGLAWRELLPLAFAVALARLAAVLAGDCLGVLAAAGGINTSSAFLLACSLTPGLAFAWPAVALGLTIALARLSLCPLGDCRSVLAAALAGALAGPLLALAMVSIQTLDGSSFVFFVPLWLLAPSLQSLSAGVVLIGMLRDTARWRAARAPWLRAGLAAAMLPALVVGPVALGGFALMFGNSPTGQTVGMTVFVFGQAATLATAAFAFLALRTLLRAHAPADAGLAAGARAPGLRLWLWTPVLALGSVSFALFPNLALQAADPGLLLAGWLGARHGRSALPVVALGALPWLVSIGYGPLAIGGGGGRYALMLALAWVCAGPAAALALAQRCARLGWFALLALIAASRLGVDLDTGAGIGFGFSVAPLLPLPFLALGLYAGRARRWSAPVAALGLSLAGSALFVTVPELHDRGSGLHLVPLRFDDGLVCLIAFALGRALADAGLLPGAAAGATAGAARRSRWLSPGACALLLGWALLTTSLQTDRFGLDLSGWHLLALPVAWLAGRLHGRGAPGLALGAAGLELGLSLLGGGGADWSAGSPALHLTLYAPAPGTAVIDALVLPLCAHAGARRAGRNSTVPGRA